MASQRVTQMSAVTTLGSTDVFYVVTQVTGTDGNNSQITYQDLSTQIGGGGGGGGGLTLVEPKTITSAVTTVTFNTGIDGNTDGVYLLLLDIKNGAAAFTTYALRPNGVTTNLTLRYTLTNATVSAATSTAWLVAAADSSIWGAGQAKIFARSTVHSVAKPRKMISSLDYSQSGTLTSINAVGLWNETSTNITSFDVVADQANGIGDGSELWLYKYAQS